MAIVVLAIVVTVGASVIFPMTIVSFGIAVTLGTAAVTATPQPPSEKIYAIFIRHSSTILPRNFCF